MRELSVNEIADVEGGLIVLKWIEAIGIADMINDVVTGFAAGAKAGFTD